MKTIEKGRERKQAFSSVFFSVFPGCNASVGRRSAAGPWWRPCQWRIQLAKLQFSFAKRFCMFREGGTTIPQALRASFLYTREPVFSCFSGKMCLIDKPSNFRHWVQGRWPCWGEGATPLMVPQVSEGYCLKDKSSRFRHWWGLRGRSHPGSFVMFHVKHCIFLDIE